MLVQQFQDVVDNHFLGFGSADPDSAALELLCLTLLREPLGFGNLRGRHEASELISFVCCGLLRVTPRASATAFEEWALTRRGQPLAGGRPAVVDPNRSIIELKSRRSTPLRVAAS